MTTTRRRGEALEHAIHQAVRDELFDRGYAAVTFEGVAAAAATSKAVLYRRWPSKPDLVLSAIASGAEFRLSVADTGSLAGDLTQLMTDGRKYFDESTRQLMLGLLADVEGAAVDTLRDILFARSSELVLPIVERARERGELGDGPIAARALTLPLDLLRHESLLRGRLSEQDIEDLIDHCVVPLFTALSSSSD